MNGLIAWMSVVLLIGAFLLSYWIKDNWSVGWSTTEMFFFIIFLVVECWGIYEFYKVTI